MHHSPPSRRSVLAGLGAGALTLPLLHGRSLAGYAKETASLVVVYLNGGPPGLFNSAGSFLAKGSFGVTKDNIRHVGNGLYVDAASLGSLPKAALDHMAAINFKHGIEKHELARAALLQTGDRSNLLLLAQAFPNPAPVRCAIVNSLGLPAGVDPHPPAENGIVHERILDLREIGQFDDEAAKVSAAYGVATTTSTIGDPASTFAAAELLVRASSNVVFIQPLFTGRPDRQIDTHTDVTGDDARKIMATILGPLRTFLARTLALPGRNVVVAMFGEFSRTVAASDHEPGGTATVVGKYVKTGTAGAQTSDGGPPPGSPPPAGLWAYLAGALRLKDHPFGENPNPELLV